MKIRELADAVEQYSRSVGQDGPVPGSPRDAPPGLLLFRRTEVTGLEATIYEPVVCLILQGAKQTIVGDRTLTVAAGEYVVFSHAVPVFARVTHATTRRPYLALIIRIDIAVLRSLYDQLGDAALRSEEASSVRVGAADGVLLDVIGRYVGLLEDPIEARVLGPLVQKELHFRLVMSEAGAMLRSLLHRDSHASSIARAIDDLRRRFRDPLEVAALARSVGMSPSSFHKHFKAVTMTTPLQYQKDLRLTEARRLLWTGQHSVSTAAFEVGYESPSQFSREYARKFGAPPRGDRRS